MPRLPEPGRTPRSTSTTDVRWARVRAAVRKYRPMKHHWTSVCVGLLALLGSGVALAQAIRLDQAPQGRVDLLDRIVAVVNKEVITQYDLSDRINRVQKEL